MNVNPSSVALTFPKGNTIERSDSLIADFEQMALAEATVYQTDVRVTEEYTRLNIEFKKGALFEPGPYILQRRLVGRAILLGGIAVSRGRNNPADWLLQWARWWFQWRPASHVWSKLRGP